MRRIVALVVALAALLGVLRPADACSNEIVKDEPAVRQLRRAEEALFEGDVEHARDLAAEVAGGKIHVPSSMQKDLTSRATRIVALSWIRDAKAMPHDIEVATDLLRVDLASRDEPDAARQADLGEAYARAGQDEAAYQILRSLHEKDLIGSPYAYAAFARVAAKRGDPAKAEDALRRCMEITPSPSICRGAYPKPPLLRGNALGYAFPGALAIFALVRRRRAKHPWSAFGDKAFAAIVIATCAFVFAFAREPWVTTLVTFAVLLVVGVTQRLAFLHAVKRGRVAGLVLRDATAGDVGLPPFSSVLHSGARVLERVPDASYREPARVGVLRLTPRRRGPLALALAAVFLLALVGSCAVLTARGAKSERASASVHEG
jgi:hypothetical protein